MMCARPRTRCIDYFLPLPALAVLFALICLTPGIAHTQLLAPARPHTQQAIALHQLRALGYWTGTSDTFSSAANKQALIAFQKVEGRPRTGKPTEEELRAISLARKPVPRDSLHQLHYEVDLNRQILFLVDSTDQVIGIIPVSTGSGKWFESEGHGRYALTPRGNFRVFYKVTGWKKSALGELYYPLYIRGGVAIHGARQVPQRPESHGCIRIPMFAAVPFFKMTPIGRTIIVYGENPPRKGKPMR